MKQDANKDLPTMIKALTLMIAKSRTWGFRLGNGDLITRTCLVWTESGRNFIHQLLNN